MAASPSHHTSCPRPFRKRRKVQQAHPSIRLFSSPTADRGSQLSWQLGHVSWQHSLGEATYTLVGANAPTTKTKFSINYLTFTTCAPPSINDHAPHEPTWKRESSDQWQASNYCLFADYLHHRDRYKIGVQICIVFRVQLGSISSTHKNSTVYLDRLRLIISQAKKLAKKLAI